MFKEIKQQIKKFKKGYSDKDLANADNFIFQLISNILLDFADCANTSDSTLITEARSIGRTAARCNLFPEDNGNPYTNLINIDCRLTDDNEIEFVFSDPEMAQKFFAYEDKFKEGVLENRKIVLSWLLDHVNELWYDA